MPNFVLEYVYDPAGFNTGGDLSPPPDVASARAAGSPSFQMSIASGTTPQKITISDTSNGLGDFDPIDQVLSAPVTIGGTYYPVGASVAINYVLTTHDGFKGYSITLGAGNSGNDPITAFVTTSPLVPDQIYVFTSEGNISRIQPPHSEFACFATGTLIKTALGERPIEDIAIGDRVMTRDHGLQVVRWTGSRTLPAIGELAPIVFDQGVLGATEPLRVSPNHRMLISGALSEMYFGTDEVLVAAKSLVNGRNVRRVAGGFVTYVHIMFDYHEILWGNGAFSESFYIGDQAHRALQSDQHKELVRIFPKLLEMQTKASLARCEARAHEGRVVAAALL